MPLPRETGLPVAIIQTVSITYASATAAQAGQLVDFGGNLVVNEFTPVFGVLLDDAVQGQIVSIAVAGLVEIISGSAIFLGAAISSDIIGRGRGSGLGAPIFARAMSSTTAANKKFQAYITREGSS